MRFSTVIWPGADQRLPSVWHDPHPPATQLLHLLTTEGSALRGNPAMARIGGMKKQLFQRPAVGLTPANLFSGSGADSRSPQNAKPVAVRAAPPGVRPDPT